VKPSVIFLAFAAAICAFLYWWSTRVERCLAREGYWYWSGAHYSLNGECKRSAGPVFELHDR
jgi:hypothetical protein